MRDVELVRLAIAGHAEALGELERRVIDILRRRAGQIIRGMRHLQLSEDELVNEIYLKFFDRQKVELSRYDPDKGTLDAYLNVLATSRVIDQVRKTVLARKRSAPLEAVSEPTDPAPSAESVAISRQLALQVREHVLSGLSAKGRVVFVMAFDDGLSAAEIAAALGTSRQIVFNHMHKARTLAREYLAASKRKEEKESR